MTIALSIRALTKRFRCGLPPWATTIDVLRGVDLDVAEGELVAAIAPAGAGKSTLLLCAAGLLVPDSGSVTWFGNARWPVGRPAGIAYVPGRCPWHRFLTVREALELYATLGEVAGRDRGRRVWEALERVGLDAHGDDTIARLTVPMRRRLAVAQALIGRPRLVILDETFDGLDDVTSGELREVLAALRTQGAAMLLATSERATATDASRVVALAAGRIGPLPPAQEPRVLDLLARRTRVAEAEA